MRLNLNETIKVKLTDLGKDIYYHQYDRINAFAGKEICKPSYPKVDDDGYTEFQLWCFIELYGEHIGMARKNVICPNEIVFDAPEVGKENKMVINIPLQINEEKMEEVIQRDYSGKVLNNITEYVKTALSRRATNYYGDRAENGMLCIVEEQVGAFLEKHKDTIIERAAEEMAKKLAKTKRGKEILENLE